MRWGPALGIFPSQHSLQPVPWNLPSTGFPPDKGHKGLSMRTCPCPPSKSLRHWMEAQGGMGHVE